MDKNLKSLIKNGTDKEHFKDLTSYEKRKIDIQTRHALKALTNTRT